MLEELNAACASTGVTVSVHNSLLCSPLAKWGNDDQCARSSLARRARLPYVAANMPDAMVVKCYACGTFQVVKQHLPMQNRFTCKVTQCKIEQPMNAFADKGVVLRSYDVREMVAAAKRLNAEKLEQRSKGVLSHQKDRIMQELNEKRALRLEQSRMLVAYGNVH